MVDRAQCFTTHFRTVYAQSRPQGLDTPERTETGQLLKHASQRTGEVFGWPGV